MASLRGRTRLRQRTAVVILVTWCLALVRPGLHAQQAMTPPTPPETTTAPVTLPEPTATLFVDPVADQSPDSVALGQPFHIRVTVPTDWQPGATVSVTLANGGRRDVLALTKIEAGDGTVMFSTPAPISIGAVLAGSSMPSGTAAFGSETGKPSSFFSITTDGTIMLDEAPNGRLATISLTGFRGPDTNVTVSLPVFNNPIDQGIWRIEQALTMLEGPLTQQRNGMAWALSQPDLPDDVRAEAQAWSNQVSLDLKLITDARDTMAGAGTSLGKLIAGSEYLALIVGRRTSGLEFGEEEQAMRVRLQKTATNDAIINNNIVTVATGITMTMYEITRTLTLAGPAYEAGQLGTNPTLRYFGYDVGAAQSSWGRPITTKEQLFAGLELLVGIGLMVGLPKLIDWLAFRSLKGHFAQKEWRTFARAPGTKPATQPPVRTGPGGTQVLPRTGPGSTQPLGSAGVAAAEGVRGGDTLPGNQRQPLSGAEDPFAKPSAAESSSPTLAGPDKTAAGNLRASTAGPPPSDPVNRVSSSATEADELRKLVADARKKEVSQEVLDLIWQNSTSFEEAATRLRAVTTLRRGKVPNDVIADGLRTSATQEEVDEILALLVEAGPQRGVLDDTIRELFANAGTRQQLVDGIRAEINQARIDARQLQRVWKLEVDEALIEAQKLARENGLNPDVIPGKTPRDKVNNIVGALLVRKGYILNAEPSEVGKVNEIFTRTFANDPLRPDTGRGRMADEDVVWLNEKLAEDPLYFDKLPRRGRLDELGEFEPILGDQPAADLGAAYRARLAEMETSATGGVSGGPPPPGGGRSTTGGFDATGSLDDIRPPAGVRNATPPGSAAGSIEGGRTANPFSEYGLADAAITKARHHFKTGAENWSTSVLPDGTVAVTSPDGMKRVTASVGSRSDGSTKVDYIIESRRDRFVDRESHAGVILRFSMPTPGSALSPLPSGSRPLNAPPATPPAAESSESAGASSPGGKNAAVTTPAPKGATPAVERRGLGDFDVFAPLYLPGIGRFDPNAAFAPSGVSVNPVEEATQRTVSVLDFIGDENRVPVIARRPVEQPFDLARLVRGLLRPRTGQASSVRSSVFADRSSFSTGPEVPSQGSAAASATPGAKVFVTSLGRLGANAFRMTVVNDGGVPITLRSGLMALEPVARLTAQDLQRELSKLAHFPQRTFTTRGYCLEREKLPPAAGAVFRLAPADQQRELAAVHRIVGAARQLRDAKALEPDTDPDDHYHSIVQWAIWSHQERFEERAFMSAFTAYTRKNVVAAGHRWSREVEEAVRDIAPNRWRDISKVLNEAQKPPPAQP